MRINLHNRDGAELRLEKVKDIDSNTSEWELKVDANHSYCLQYIRVIGNYEAIDPSGGPFLSVGDEIDKYLIVNIINPTTLWLSERNNDN